MSYTPTHTQHEVLQPGAQAVTDSEIENYYFFYIFFVTCHIAGIWLYMHGHSSKEPLYFS